MVGRRSRPTECPTSAADTKILLPAPCAPLACARSFDREED
jgi:hypothetical protein